MIHPKMMEHCNEAYRTGYYHGYFSKPKPEREFMDGPGRYQYLAGVKQGAGDAAHDKEVEARIRDHHQDEADKVYDRARSVA